MENGLDTLFNFQGQNIDVSSQAVFYLMGMDLHDEESKKINMSDPLRSNQRRSFRFLYFVMMFFPYQDDTKFKYSHMSCRVCVQLPLDTNAIYSNINNQIPNTPHVLLVCLSDFYNGRNPDTFTLNKYKGYLSSEFFIDIFKAVLLLYVNEFLF